MVQVPSVDGGSRKVVADGVQKRLIPTADDAFVAYQLTPRRGHLQAPEKGKQKT